MPKSKYPQSLDTSVQLPAVRDSVLSEPINSLRSAIIQIERTLGVNPQGTAGNTVASRLNRIMDGNGNLLPEALTQAGLLSGPIGDSDISETAAISERKLNLNFPTQLLQDEISMLQSDIDSISSQIAEFSVKLASHLSADALNRHPATSISLTPTAATPSDTGTVDLESTEVQDAFEVLYNQHINYTGVGISSTNNSHTASQIYFDNSNVSGAISSENVQDAIEALSGSGASEKSIHQDVQHSNGILRVGKLETPSDDEISEVLASDISVSFTASDGDSSGTFTITLLDPVDLTNYELRPFDYVKIVDSTDTNGLFTGIFEIKDYTTTGTNLNTIDVYGFAGSSSTVGTTITIGKNIERRTNEAGLLLGITEEATLTSARFLRLSNPNANRIISRNINPMAITSSNRYIVLTVDNDPYTLDLFDATATRQTIDTILVKINEKLAEEAAHAMAYRVDFESGGSEIAFVHNIPDDSTDTHTLKVSRSTDNGIDALGFGHLEDVVPSSLYGTKYFLNGETYSGIKKRIDSTELVFFAGSNHIGIGNSSIDFIKSGVRVGDLVIITDATDNLDNGSYIISQVESTQIRVNSGQLPSGFSDVANVGTTRFRIFANTVSVEDITFDRVGGAFGSSLLDIFMNRDRELYFAKILEYSSVVIGSASLLDIVDIEGDNFYDETITINAEEDPDDASAFYINIDGAEPIKIVGERKYIWLTSHNKNIRVRVFIPDAATIASKITSDGNGFSITVYLFEKANTETNLLLGRVGYNNFNGRFYGGVYGPRVFSKVPVGTIGVKDISYDVRSELIERPFSELRYNGVIYGFEIENISIDTNNFYNFDIRRGRAYVNGKKIDKETVTTVVTDIDSASVDKIYLIIDESGNYQIETAVPSSCITPFGESDFALLGSIEYDGVNLDYIDLRLFIDHLDLKLLNSVTVSPEKGMGHFTDVIKALKYTKRFSQQFPNAGTPILHLKSGTHKVELDYTYGESSLTWDPLDATNLQIFYDKQIESGFLIDFPVVIEGEGPSTVIELINNSTFTDTTYELTMPITLLGNGFSAASRGHDTLGDGGFVEIKNLRLRNTRISIVDYNLTRGPNDLKLGVKLFGIYFDFQNFPGTFIDGINGPRAVEFLEISNTSTNKGSVTIDNCIFVKCGIHFDSVSRIKNLNITNNTIIDDGDTTNFLLQNIFDFTTATSGSNINITNNRYNTNLNAGGAGGPEIVAGSSLGWGERFDRDIRVGGVGYFEGSTVADSYEYTNQQELTVHFWADELAMDTTGFQNLWSNPGSWSFNTTLLSSGGVDAFFPHITIPVGSQSRFRIKLPKGGTLKNIIIGLDKGTTSPTDLDVSFYSISQFGGSSFIIGAPPISLLATESLTYSSLGLFGNNIVSRTFDFESHGISLTHNSQYLVEIAASNYVTFYYIRVTILLDSVEHGIGLV